MTYKQTHKNLTVWVLTAEQHERTCGYWFVVTSGEMSHTAFETRAGLDRWLSERGLSLLAEIPPAGQPGGCAIVGKYREESHGEFLTDDYHDGMGPGDFYNLHPIAATTDLSNGRYTLALITEDADGTRVIHTLNPNVRDRVIFDHRRTAELMR